MINKIQKTAQKRMEKSIESLKKQISKIHTGRASINILDGVTIKHYDTIIPLRKLANIIVENSHTLVISIFDKKMSNLIEKTIVSSNLDLTTSSLGNVIRVHLPPLTEERRKNFIKIVRHDAEQSRIAIRNIRRDSNDKIKVLFKNKQISEDNERRSQDYIQKITDNFIKKIDEILTQKETELLKF